MIRRLSGKLNGIALILMLGMAIPATAQTQPISEEAQLSTVGPIYPAMPAITPISPAPAVKPDLLYLTSRMTLYGSAISDLGTTWHGLNQGRYEANPVLGQSRVRQGALVMGSVVALDFVSRGLFKSGHPKLAAVVNFIVSGAHGYATVRNAR
jgi:hypothetical protein